MRRVEALVVFGDMAGLAVCGRAGKSGSMTFYTGSCRMRAGQRKRGVVVVKDKIPLTGRVTGETGCTGVNISIHTLVFFVGLRICVAGSAGELRPVARTGMTIGTLGPFPFVLSTVNGEVLHVMVKCRRHPGAF